jgi:acyl-coenzyme A synthetase/AMP-(fatty) acid ligase
VRATEPLIDRPADAVLFQRPQGPVSVAAFLADATALARRLPEAATLINICRDRHAFAVAFAAGLIAGRTSLLNVDPARLAAVAAEHGSCVVADWAAAPADGCERVLVEPGGPLPPTVEIPMPEIACDLVAAVVFTSGSTGTPVPHVKRWGSLVQRSRAAAAAFGLAGGTVVGTVPPQHMYGFETTVLLPLHAPVASWCGPAFFPADVAAAAALCAAPLLLVTTPLQLRALLLSAMALPVAAAVSATAPLDPALAGQVEAAWDAPVLEIFGATECGSIARRRTTAGPDWTAYPGVDLRLDGDAAAVAAPWMDPVRLADVIEAVPGGFRLVGRRTDVVKLGGRRASLPGLDRALLQIEGVDDGAFVVPEADDARLVAVVVAPARTGADILAELRRVVDPVFVPRRVIRVERLPRNAVGKLPRQALLALLDGAPT